MDSKPREAVYTRVFHPDRCLIHLLEKYVSVCPIDVLENNGLYLRPLQKPLDELQFSRRCLGHNTSKKNWSAPLWRKVTRVREAISQIIPSGPQQPHGCLERVLMSSPLHKYPFKNQFHKFANPCHVNSKTQKEDYQGIIVNIYVYGRESKIESINF